MRHAAQEPVVYVSEAASSLPVPAFPLKSTGHGTAAPLCDYHDITEFAVKGTKKVNKGDILDIINELKKTPQPQEEQPQSSLVAYDAFSEKEEDEEEEEEGEEDEDYDDLDAISIPKLEDFLASADARLDLLMEESRMNPIKVVLKEYAEAVVAPYKGDKEMKDKMKEEGRAITKVAKDVMLAVDKFSTTDAEYLIKCLQAQIRKKELPDLIDSTEKEVERIRRALDLAERQHAREKREKKRQKKKDGKKRQLTDEKTSGKGKRLTPAKMLRLK